MQKMKVNIPYSITKSVSNLCTQTEFGSGNINSHDHGGVIMNSNI